MFTAAAEAFELYIPPWPEFITASYRCFDEDEKHVTRLCKNFVLLFMLESSLCFVEDGQNIEVEAGHWYIQVPGLKQEGIKGSPAPKYFYIHFNADGDPCVTDKTGAIRRNSANQLMPMNFCLPVKGIFDPQHFISLFDKLLMPVLQPGDILRRQTVFYTILTDLIRSSNSGRSGYKDIMIRLMTYLADNFDKHVTSETLTNEFHFTADYLTRRMKRYAGITPCQYIQQIRIEKAKELLANTDHKLSHIAKEVGYNDMSVFYKAFFKQAGIAPGIWRLINRSS
jgi:AraC-like DNA-binding protein